MAHLLGIFHSVLLLLSLIAASPLPLPRPQKSITPKVMVISMWTPEAEVWYKNFPHSSLGNLTHHSIWTPGLSMVYPRIYCNPDFTICQATVGEGEINAAASMTAILLSPKFDFSKTYFIFTGIAGVNPKYATLGSVAIARYAVQVALQYEIDSKSAPEGWVSGYFGYGNDAPLKYPTITYGTEVFELSAPLQEVAFQMASIANLSDADAPAEYRSKYVGSGEAFSAAVKAPGVVKCDVATSDVYYSGTILAEAFENTTEVWTNGTGKLCMTAQEDNANLEVMLRFAIEEMVDWSRIIVIRTGSNFDRPPPRVSDWEHLALSEQNGFEIAIENSYRAGMAIIHGILQGWDCLFDEGIKPDHYVGDILGSLGGTPDFGLGSKTGGERVQPRGDILAADIDILGVEDDVEFGHWGDVGRDAGDDDNEDDDPRGPDWPPEIGPPREC